ncbi:phospholipase D-like domain-containing protein [Klebsiella pneumoniae]
MLGAINNARQSIDVAAYSFTSKPGATALAGANRRGVAVRVVADEKANSDRYTAVTYKPGRAGAALTTITPSCTTSLW